MMRLATATAEPVEQYYNCETKNYESRIDVTNHSPTFEPDLVVPSQSMQCTPETMSKMEP